MQIIFLCAYCYARPTNLKTTTQFYYHFLEWFFPYFINIYTVYFLKPRIDLFIFHFLDFTRILTEKYVLNLTEYHFMRLFSRTKNHNITGLVKKSSKKYLLCRQNIYIKCYLLENKYTTYLIHFLEKYILGICST